MQCKSCGAEKFKKIDDTLICGYCGATQHIKAIERKQISLLFYLLPIALILIALMLQYSSNKITPQSTPNGITVTNQNSNIGTQLIESNQHKPKLTVTNKDSEIKKQTIRQAYSSVKHIGTSSKSKNIIPISSSSITYNSKGEILSKSQTIYPHKITSNCIDKDGIPHITVRTKSPTIDYKNGIKNAHINNIDINIGNQNISYQKVKDGTQYLHIVTKDTDRANLTFKEKKMIEALEEYYKIGRWTSKTRAAFDVCSE